MKLFFRFLCIFLSFISIVFCVSCSNGNEGISVSVTELSEAISSAAPLDEGYYSASDSYCKYYFKDENGGTLLGNIVGTENWTVQKSKSQSSENEFGIFITDKKSVSTVKLVCEKYIETRRKAYMDAKAAYSPEEYEKFRDAEVFVTENYVIYLIMKKSDVNAAKASVSALFE